MQPPILDNIFQVVVFADSLGLTSISATWVPTYVKRLWISSSGLEHSHDGQQLQVLASRRSGNARFITSSLWALDAEGCSQILVADGLETTLVTDTLNAKVEEIKRRFTRKLCYDIAYKPGLSIMDSEVTTRYLQQDASLHTNDAPASQYRALKHFTFASIARITEIVPTSAVFQDQPHLQIQLSWIVDQVASAVKSPPSGIPPDSFLMAETSKYEYLCSEFEEIGHVGSFMVSFSRNTIDMLQGRSQFSQTATELNALQQYQRVLLDGSPIISGLQTILHAIAHKSPALDVLQVGDIGGIVMECVLATLTTPTKGSSFSRFTRYDYTEPATPGSPTEAILKKLEATGRIQCRALDPQRDLIEQGFEGNQFDLVLMANGFDTNDRAKVTLRCIRRLMRGDGKIIIIGITNPNSPLWKFVAGFFPRRRHVLQSPQGDQNRPPIPTTSYKHLLLDAGFYGPEILLHDSPIEEEWVIGLIISSATAPQIQPSVVIHRPVLIITGLDSTPATELSASLCLHLRELGHLDPRRASLRRAVEGKGIKNILVVVLECDKWLPLEDIAREDFAVFHATLTRCRNVFWLSSDGQADETAPSNGATIGLARTLRMEYHDYIFATVTISQSRVKNLPMLLRGVDPQPYEPESVQIGDLLHIPRVYESADLNQKVHELTSSSTVQKRRIREKNIKLKMQQPVLLDTLSWEHAENERLPLGIGGIDIEVTAVGVNFKDCLTALGRVAEDTIGSECAGVVVSVGTGCKLRPGDHVLVSALDTFTRQYRCPDHRQIAKRGVCPHPLRGWGGGGGTGQAAIQVAQLLGADIFTTVGSSRKKDLLMDLYGVASEKILNSRDLSFRDDIRQLTGGKGVDVVLNSLAGDALITSWECVAPYVDIAAMTKKRPYRVEEALSFIVDMFNKKKFLVASPIKSFPASQIEAAFRYLQSGSNPGKVVVEMDPDEEVPYPVLLEIGLRLHVYCCGRVWRPRAQSQASSINVEIRASRGKALSFRKGVGAKWAHMPAIKGLIQAAMAIHDSMFDNMSYESWSECLRPKIHGTWNLHQQLPRDLDFFVMFSSTAGIIGSQGQSNHAAGNTFQDKLAAYRLARGQAAISLNLSFLESEGYMAENHETLMRYANVKHMLLMSQPEVLAMLEHYCDPAVSRLVNSSQSRVVLGLALPADVTSRGMEPSSWMYEPMFANLHQIATANHSPSSDDSPRARDTGPSLTKQAIEAPSIQEAGSILAKGLAAKVIGILSLASDQFNPSLPLYSYGVDSLIAVERRNWVIKVLKVDMAIFEILGGAEKIRVGGKSGLP
ncbi:hypothetical protein F5B21DRAFT_524900 [Xylaria acuta]|nr:hypothetical protein F5B21DRAFT_524900 [Xylaria acuta]